jgi:hypothetical protein
LPDYEENYLIVDEESFNTYKNNENIGVFIKAEDNSFIPAISYNEGTKYYRPVRKTFAQKEFSGYKADEKIQSSYTPILKGYLCSAYNTDIVTYYECEDGTVTTDFGADNIKIAKEAKTYNGYPHDVGDPIIARKEV